MQVRSSNTEIKGMTSLSLLCHACYKCMSRPSGIETTALIIPPALFFYYLFLVSESDHFPLLILKSY